MHCVAYRFRYGNGAHSGKLEVRVIRAPISSSRALILLDPLSGWSHNLDRRKDTSNREAMAVPPASDNVTASAELEHERDVITKDTPMSQILLHLRLRGIPNLTEEVDLGSVSNYPIATGGFSDIFGAKRQNGAQVAIKLPRIVSSDPRDAGLQIASRSVYNWSKCRHPNIHEFLGVMLFHDRIGMISSWESNGNIRNYLQSEDVSVTDRLRLCAEISEGVAHLHQNGIVHGDIKGNNVLVSLDGTAMLTDFDDTELGERSLVFTATRKLSFSLRWTAPELVLGELSCKTRESDVYSLGMEVMTSKEPWAHIRGDAMVYGALLRREIPPRTSEIPGDDLWNLLTECWKSESQARPGSRYLLDTVKSIWTDSFEQQKAKIENSWTDISSTSESEFGIDSRRGQPISRHHTIVSTDYEANNCRHERRAQPSRRAARKLKREQRQERHERREARKPHSRDLERAISALQSHSRSRMSSRRNPVTLTTRSGRFLKEELKKFRLFLSKTEKDLSTLQDNVQDLTERLRIQSKLTATAEARCQDYRWRLQDAETARERAESNAFRRYIKSSRLQAIYETARAQQEEILRELEALQEDSDETDWETARMRFKARKSREDQRGRKHRHHKIERIAERVQQERPMPQIVTESVVYEEESTESRRTTPLTRTPESSERDPNPIIPPPPIIPPFEPEHDSDPLPDLPSPPPDIQMPEVVDPAPLPPVGSSTWTDWKNRLGRMARRSNSYSNSESYSQDSYLDDPGMQGGYPVYIPVDRDVPSRSQYHGTESNILSRSQYASRERNIPSRSQYSPPERDIPPRSHYAPERGASPQPRQSSSHGNPVAISKYMPLGEVVSHLIIRGCQDLSKHLNELTFSVLPSRYGGSGDVYCGKLLDLTVVCVKVPRISEDTSQSAKSQVVSPADWVLPTYVLKSSQVRIAEGGPAEGGAVYT
ncbi:unnamed protein product [Rhizoctonia solani]|uniref:Protein kinase domain-containing protein n=1 Tax=Rhizoctonia solani TaxID=456999 RepID=A0A8H3BFL4_9AGAM|nr:unnamed protein product [Rhizoctonia solani]